MQYDFSGMSRAARMDDNAMIAFLLFCLRVEEQRKRKLH